MPLDESLYKWFVRQDGPVNIEDITEYFTLVEHQPLGESMVLLRNRGLLDSWFDYEAEEWKYELKQ